MTTTNVESMIYQRQEKIGLKIPKSVGIVGVGGVGSWLAYFLALAGVERIVLFDHDTVSDHNLNRLPLFPQFVGMNKSEAMASMIRAHRPFIEIETFGKFVPEYVDKLPNLDLEWIVAGTDSLKSRHMVAEWAKSKNIKYMEIAAEGEVGSVMGAPGDWATPEEEHPGYQSVPVWVGPCVMCASIAASHILHDQPLSDSAVYQMGWANDKVEMKLL